jgi:hypothetical protein
VSVLAWIWEYGVPLLVVAGAVGVLVSAIRTDAGRLTTVRSNWPFLLLTIMWTGDAAVGDARPVFERVAKGTVAALVWISVAIVVVRRRRLRADPESS